ncbi:hypothetical protein ACFLRA_00215 [Bdellovibrionota bacterium]
MNKLLKAAFLLALVAGFGTINPAFSSEIDEATVQILTQATQEITEIATEYFSNQQGLTSDQPSEAFNQAVIRWMEAGVPFEHLKDTWFLTKAMVMTAEQNKITHAARAILENPNSREVRTSARQVIRDSIFSEETAQKIFDESLEYLERAAPAEAWSQDNPEATWEEIREMGFEEFFVEEDVRRATRNRQNLNLLRAHPWTLRFSSWGAFWREVEKCQGMEIVQLNVPSEESDNEDENPVYFVDPHGTGYSQLAPPRTEYFILGDDLSPMNQRGLIGDLEDLINPQLPFVGGIGGYGSRVGRNQSPIYSSPRHELFRRDIPSFNIGRGEDGWQRQIIVLPEEEERGYLSDSDLKIQIPGVPQSSDCYSQSWTFYSGCDVPAEDLSELDRYKNAVEELGENSYEYYSFKFKSDEIIKEYFQTAFKLGFKAPNSNEWFTVREELGRVGRSLEIHCNREGFQSVVNVQAVYAQAREITAQARAIREELQSLNPPEWDGSVQFALDEGFIDRSSVEYDYYRELPSIEILKRAGWPLSVQFSSLENLREEFARRQRSFRGRIAIPRRQLQFARLQLLGWPREALESFSLYYEDLSVLERIDYPVDLIKRGDHWEILFPAMFVQGENFGNGPFSSRYSDSTSPLVSITPQDGGLNLPFLNPTLPQNSTQLTIMLPGEAGIITEREDVQIIRIYPQSPEILDRTERLRLGGEPFPTISPESSTTIVVPRDDFSHHPFDSRYDFYHSSALSSGTVTLGDRDSTFQITRENFHLFVAQEEVDELHTLTRAARSIDENLFRYIVVEANATRLIPRILRTRYRLGLETNFRRSGMPTREGEEDSYGSILVDPEVAAEYLEPTLLRVLEESINGLRRLDSFAPGILDFESVIDRSHEEFARGRERLDQWLLVERQGPDSWYVTVLKAFPRTLEAILDITVGNILGLLSGEHFDTWSNYLFDYDLPSLGIGSGFVDLQRRFWNWTGVGSILGTDEQLIEMNNWELWAASNPLVQAGSGIGGLMEGAHELYVGLVKLTNGLNQAEYEWALENSWLFKAGDVSFYIAEASFGLAMTLMGVPATGLGDAAILAQAGKTVGTAASIGGLAGWGQELIASSRLGENFSYSRFFSNLGKSTAGSLLFMGGVAKIAQGIAATGGATRAGSLRAMGTARTTSKAIDVVEALGDAPETIRLFKHHQNQREWFGAFLIALANIYDSMDISVSGCLNTLEQITQRRTDISRYTYDVDQAIRIIGRDLYFELPEEFKDHIEMVHQMGNNIPGTDGQTPPTVGNYPTEVLLAKRAVLRAMFEATGMSRIHAKETSNALITQGVVGNENPNLPRGVIQRTVMRLFGEDVFNFVYNREDGALYHRYRKILTKQELDSLVEALKMGRYWEFGITSLWGSSKISFWAIYQTLPVVMDRLVAQCPRGNLADVQSYFSSIKKYSQSTYYDEGTFLDDVAKVVAKEIESVPESENLQEHLEQWIQEGRQFWSSLPQAKKEAAISEINERLVRRTSRRLFQRYYYYEIPHAVEGSRITLQLGYHTITGIIRGDSVILDVPKELIVLRADNSLDHLKEVAENTYGPPHVYDADIGLDGNFYLWDGNHRFFLYDRNNERKPTVKIKIPFPPRTLSVGNFETYVSSQGSSTDTMISVVSGEMDALAIFGDRLRQRLISESDELVRPPEDAMPELFPVPSTETPRDGPGVDTTTDSSPQETSSQDHLGEPGLHQDVVHPTPGSTPTQHSPRFQEASEAARQEVWDHNVGQYNLTQEERYEVARISAERDPIGTSQNISKYRLTLQQRLRVAKIAFAQDPTAVQFLRKYNLNSTQRFVLAKLVANQNPSVLIANLRIFRLNKTQKITLAAIIHSKSEDEASFLTDVLPRFGVTEAELRSYLDAVQAKASESPIVVHGPPNLDVRREREESLNPTPQKFGIIVHEAGHATVAVAANVPGLEPTCVDCAFEEENETQGFTGHNEVNESLIETRNDRISYLAIFLAGKVAEMMQLSSGHNAPGLVDFAFSSDFAKALSYARKIAYEEIADDVSDRENAVERKALEYLLDAAQRAFDLLGSNSELAGNIQDELRERGWILEGQELSEVVEESRVNPRYSWIRGMLRRRSQNFKEIRQLILDSFRIRKFDEAVELGLFSRTDTRSELFRHIQEVTQRVSRSESGPLAAEEVQTLQEEFQVANDNLPRQRRGSSGPRDDFALHFWGNKLIGDESGTNLIIATEVLRLFINHGTEKQKLLAMQYICAAISMNYNLFKRDPGRIRVEDFRLVSEWMLAIVIDIGQNNSNFPLQVVLAKIAAKYRNVPGYVSHWIEEGSNPGQYTNSDEFKEDALRHWQITHPNQDLSEEIDYYYMGRTVRIGPAIAQESPRGPPQPDMNLDFESSTPDTSEDHPQTPGVQNERAGLFAESPEPTPTLAQESEASTQPSPRFEEAIKAAQDSDWHLEIGSYGLTQEERFKVALVAAEANAFGVSYYIEEFDLTEEQKFEVAKIAFAEPFWGEHLAGHMGYGPAGMISDYDFAEEEHRFEVAKIVAKINGIAISMYIPQYDLTEEHRFEVAKLAAERSGEPVSRLLLNYDLTQEEDRYEVAKIAAAENGEGTSINVQNYNLTEEHRFEVAKIAAQESGEGISYYIKKYRLSEEEDRFEVAKIAAAKDGEGVSVSISNYGLTEQHRYEVLLIAFRSSPTREVILTANKQYKLSPERRTRFYQEAFAINPEAVISDLSGINLSRVEAVENPDAEMDILRALHQFAQRKEDSWLPWRRVYDPVTLPEEWIPMLFDRFKDREIGFGLLREAARLRNRGEEVPLDSLELIARAAGLSYEGMRDVRYSEKALSTFYTLVLELQEGMNVPIFSILPIGKDVLSERKMVALNEFLLVLRNLFMARGNSIALKQQILSELAERWGEVSRDNIKDVTEEIKRKVVETIRAIFSNTSLDFTYEQFEELKERWGDLEPVFILIARFNGKENWRKEIAILAKVFQACLEGKFEELKFEGDPNSEDDQDLAQAQLAALRTEEARREWRRRRTRVSIIAPEDSSPQQSSEDIVASAKDVLKRNLIPHLNVTEDQLFQLSQEWTQEVAEVVVNGGGKFRGKIGRLRQKYKEIMERVTGEEVVENDEFTNSLLLNIRNALLRNLLEAEERAEIETLVVFLKDLINYRPELIAPENRRQVVSDLKDIERKVKERVETRRNGEIVFTTTFADPKLLLTIGDLVRCSSCQNYRTGSVIQTLLGYVIDANVQGMASFILRPNKHLSQKDHRKLFQAIQDGKGIEIEFDGNRRVATFKWDGGEVTTNELGHAYLRQVIKLGQASSDRAGLRLENEYVDPHDATGRMRDHHRDILVEMAQAIAGVVDEGITVSQSRNSGGVYSDLAGGVKTDSYEVPAPSEKEVSRLREAEARLSNPEEEGVQESRGPPGLLSERPGFFGISPSHSNTDIPTEIPGIMREGTAWGNYETPPNLHLRKTGEESRNPNPEQLSRLIHESGHATVTLASGIPVVAQYIDCCTPEGSEYEGLFRARYLVGGKGDMIDLIASLLGGAIAEMMHAGPSHDQTSILEGFYDDFKKAESMARSMARKKVDYYERMRKAEEHGSVAERVRIEEELERFTLRYLLNAAQRAFDLLSQNEELLKNLVAGLLEKGWILEGEDIAEIVAESRNNSRLEWIKNLFTKRPPTFNRISKLIQNCFDGTILWVENDIAPENPRGPPSEDSQQSDHSMQTRPGFEKAMEAANDGDSSFKIENYDLTENERFEVAKVLAERGVEGVNFRNFNLTEEHLTKVMLIVHKNFRDNLVQAPSPQDASHQDHPQSPRLLSERPGLFAESSESTNSHVEDSQPQRRKITPPNLASRRSTEESINPSPEKLATIVHESAHAAVALASNIPDAKVHYVDCCYPDETEGLARTDTYPTTKEEKIDFIAIKLAGFIAEGMHIAPVVNGQVNAAELADSNDFEDAAEMANSMAIEEVGTSIRSRSKREEAIEQKTLEYILQAAERAFDLLTKRSDLLERIEVGLLENGWILESDDIAEILMGAEIDPSFAHLTSLFRTRTVEFEEIRQLIVDAFEISSEMDPAYGPENPRGPPEAGSQTESSTPLSQDHQRTLELLREELGHFAAFLNEEFELRFLSIHEYRSGEMVNGVYPDDALVEKKQLAQQVLLEMGVPNREAAQIAGRLVAKKILGQNDAYPQPENIIQTVIWEHRANPATLQIPRSTSPFFIEHIDVPLALLAEDGDNLESITEEFHEDLIFEKAGRLFVRWFVNPEDRRYILEIERRIRDAGFSTTKHKHFIGRLTASRSIIVSSPRGGIFSVKVSTFGTGGPLQDKPLNFDKAKRHREVSDRILEIQRKRAFRYFTFLPEVAVFGMPIVGSSFRHGMLVRDISPINSEKLYLPGFSVLSEGEEIQRVLEANGVTDPVEFWEEHYVKPLGRAMGELAARCGIRYSSAHPQNWLIELDSDLRPTGRIVFRDIGDTRDIEGDSFQLDIGLSHLNLVPSWLTRSVKMGWDGTFFESFEETYMEIAGKGLEKWRKQYDYRGYSIRQYYFSDIPEESPATQQDDIVLTVDQRETLRLLREELGDYARLLNPEYEQRFLAIHEYRSGEMVDGVYPDEVLIEKKYLAREVLQDMKLAPRRASQIAGRLVAKKILGKNREQDGSYPQPPNLVQMVNWDVRANPAIVNVPRSPSVFFLEHIDVPVELLLEGSSSFESVPAEFRNELFFEKSERMFVRWFINPEDRKYVVNIEDAIRNRGYSTEKHKIFIGRLTASRSIIVSSPRGRVYSMKVSAFGTGGPLQDKPLDFEKAKWHLEISQRIARIQAEREFKYFSVLPEVAAFGIQESGRGFRHGMLIRDLTALVADKFYLPAFSIFSRSEDMQRVIEANDINDPAKFWEEHYIRPLGRAMGELFARVGVTYSSAHPQNWLIELDSELKPTGRIVFRDIGDTRGLDGPYLVVDVGLTHLNTPPAWLPSDLKLAWDRTVFETFEETYSELKGKKLVQYLEILEVEWSTKMYDYGAE